ncbi:hypothetical protein V6582_11945 [Agrobacterium vitis]
MSAKSVCLGEATEPGLLGLEALLAGLARHARVKPSDNGTRRARTGKAGLKTPTRISLEI